MARLSALGVVSKKILAGKLRGERRSRKKGESLEFADYRNYSQGDDLRVNLQAIQAWLTTKPH